MPLSVHITIDAQSPAEFNELRETLLTVLQASNHVAAGTDTGITTMPPATPEPTPKPAPAKRSRGRARKKETVIEEASPAATPSTTPEEMRTEAMRLLGAKFGTRGGKDLKKLLKDYGVQTVPDVPDERAQDFLAATKALCADTSVEPPQKEEAVQALPDLPAEQTSDEELF